MGPFVITQCITDDTKELQSGAKKSRYNICHIKPYKLETKIEDINTKNVDGGVNL